MPAGKTPNEQQNYRLALSVPFCRCSSYMTVVSVFQKCLIANTHDSIEYLAVTDIARILFFFCLLPWDVQDSACRQGLYRNHHSDKLLLSKRHLHVRHSLKSAVFEPKYCNFTGNNIFIQFLKFTTIGINLFRWPIAATTRD